MTKSSISFCPLIISLLLSSCGSTSKPANEIIAYKYHSFKYELQIKYHTKGRGNIHQLSLSKYEFDASDWIYLNALKGNVPADSLVLTHFQRKTEYPWNQSLLKGRVEFKDDSTIKIDFKMPNYNDSGKVQFYEPYEFNGIYKLIVRQDTSVYNDDDLMPHLSH
jgi:hypothetical protein